MLRSAPPPGEKGVQLSPRGARLPCPPPTALGCGRSRMRLEPAWGTAGEEPRGCEIGGNGLDLEIAAPPAALERVARWEIETYPKHLRPIAGALAVGPAAGQYTRAP